LGPVIRAVAVAGREEQRRRGMFNREPRTLVYGLGSTRAVGNGDISSSEWLATTDEAGNALTA
jgi:hypothetical protein